MIRSILNFVLITLGLAFVGSVLVVVSIGDGSLVPVDTIGMLLIIFSPLLAGLWLWRQFKKRKHSSKEKERTRLSDDQKANDEQERKAFLRRRFLERQRLIETVDRHRGALIRNIERAMKKNDYGALVEDNRQEAFVEFFASMDLDMSVIDMVEAVELVVEQLEIRDQEDRQVGFDATNLPFDGHAFEKWVAEALIGFGWQAKVTSGSGDQGIDVIAEKDGKKLGIQCKLYSSAIGNKAVQEAHAGKSYYDADAVAVLSNASYTSSAKDLARVTGVELLSHHDIPDLYEKIFG